MRTSTPSAPVKTVGADDVVAVVASLRSIYARWTRTTMIQQMREDWDDLFRERAQPWPLEELEAGGVAAEWIAAADAQADRVILYLHGGGFRMGSIDSHRDLMQRLSFAAGARVLGINYRLSPEHVFPAAVEDALSAYRWLLHRGVRPSCIALAGDSAGAGLSAARQALARAGSFLRRHFIEEEERPREGRGE